MSRLFVVLHHGFPSMSDGFGPLRPFLSFKKPFRVDVSGLAVLLGSEHGDVARRYCTRDGKDLWERMGVPR